MKTTIYTMIAAGIISVFFCAGVWHGKRMVYAELNANQKITIESQKDLKKSLKNQIDNNFTNYAHWKTVDMARERWLDEVSVEGE